MISRRAALLGALLAPFAPKVAPTRSAVVGIDMGALDYTSVMIVQRDPWLQAWAYAGAQYPCAISDSGLRSLTFVHPSIDALESSDLLSDAGSRRTGSQPARQSASRASFGTEHAEGLARGVSSLDLAAEAKASAAPSGG